MMQVRTTTGRVLPRRPDLYISLGSVLVGVLVLVYALSLPTLEDNRPGPGLFPGIVGGGFILFGLVLAVQSAVGSARTNRAGRPGQGPASEEEAAPPTPVLDFEQETISNSRAWVNGVAVVGGVLFYMLVAEPLGFMIAMFLLTLLIMLILKARIIASVVTAVVLSMGLWFVFEKGLMVQLPNGLLW